MSEEFLQTKLNIKTWDFIRKQEKRIAELEAKKQDLFPLHHGERGRPVMEIICKLEQRLIRGEALVDGIRYRDYMAKKLIKKLEQKIENHLNTEHDLFNKHKYRIKDQLDESLRVQVAHLVSKNDTLSAVLKSNINTFGALIDRLDIHDRKEFYRALRKQSEKLDGATEEGRINIEWNVNALDALNTTLGLQKEKLIAEFLERWNYMMERVEFHTENPDSELMDELSAEYKEWEGRWKE